MKTLMIVGLIIAFTQATSPPVTLQERSAKALQECVQEKSLDLKHIGGILKNNILPEDNPEFTDFFLCYWTKLGLIKEKGGFDEALIKVLSPALLKDKFPNIADLEKVAGEAYEKCKDIPETGSAGLTAIKYRNCLMQYAQDHQ